MDQSAGSAPNQKTPLHPDGELVELLWRNGGVVAQTHRRSFDRGQSGGNPGTSGVTGEETAVWFPDGNALDRDLYSQLRHSIANVHSHEGRDTGAFARPPARSGAGSSFCGSNMVTASTTRRSQRPAVKHQTRVAEVHNLSERRRRDRINKKTRRGKEAATGKN